MHNHSYENEFNLHVNEISFSYEKMGTKTRFEEEAKGNSEMAYLFSFFCLVSRVTLFSCCFRFLFSGGAANIRCL